MFRPRLSFFDWDFDFNGIDVPDHISIDPASFSRVPGIMVLEGKQGSWDFWKPVAWRIPDEQTAKVLAAAWYHKHRNASDRLQLVHPAGNTELLNRPD